MACASWTQTINRIEELNQEIIAEFAKMGIIIT